MVNHVVTHWSEKNVPYGQNNHSEDVTKVVIFAYARGGSSFLGEFFRCFEDLALYFYEPLDGVMMYMMGTHQFMIPLDVHFNSDMSPR